LLNHWVMPKSHSAEFESGAIKHPVMFIIGPMSNYHWKARAKALGYTQERNRNRLSAQMTSLDMRFPKIFFTAFVMLTCMLLAIQASAQATASTTIRRGLGPEPDSINIHQAQGLAAVNLLRDLREGLVTFDQNGELAPGQAVSWQLLDGGKRYRFSLRPDARWSNGDQVTSSDFVRAWHRAFSPDSQATTAGLLQDVLHADEILAGGMEVKNLGIKAVKPDILDILLEAPAPWILEIMAHPVSYPLHSSSLDDPRLAPVNGAFTLAEWIPRSTLRLKRNPEYYAAESVALETVEYYPIEDPAAELSRYRAGELEISETIPPGRFDWLRQNLGADLRIHPYLGSFWLGLNLRHPALGHSADLRRALALAIDREVLIRVVLGAGEMPAWSVVPPGVSAYQPALMNESGWTQQQREAEAVRLFKKSGFGEREPLLLELRYNTSGVHRRVAVAVSAMWKQALGVLTELINEEWKVFVNNRKMGVVTEVFRGGWIADYADPSSFLDLFIGGNTLSTTFYANPSFDELMKSASLTGGEARMELLGQAESILMQDMPVIPLYYYVSRHLVNPRVGGFTDNVRDIHLSRYLELETEKH
jgi:oligopeptide transport system substrate-binding protein